MNKILPTHISINRVLIIDLMPQGEALSELQFEAFNAHFKLYRLCFSHWAMLCTDIQKYLMVPSSHQQTQHRVFVAYKNNLVIFL